MKKTKQVNIPLCEDEYNIIKKLAEADDRSIAYTARKIILKAIKEEKKEEKK